MPSVATMRVLPAALALLMFAFTAALVNADSFTGSGTETSPTYYMYPAYGGCAGASYDTHITRTADPNGDYVYTLYLRYRGDYSGWIDAGSTPGITSTATMGGRSGRDTVYAQLVVDQS